MTIHADTLSLAAEVKGLHAKLAFIRGQLNGQIRKTGEHTQGGPRYKFVEALEVGRQFVELASVMGLTMVPEDGEVVNVRPTTSGKQTVISIRVTWRITDSETGESTTVVSFGEGADNSDKALPKAQTNAMKYAILMLLQAAGDDPEKDGDEDDERPARRSSRRAPRRTRDEDDRPPGEPADTEDAASYPEGDPPPARRRPRRSEPDPKPGVAMASNALKAKIRARQHEVGLDDDQFRALGMHFTGKSSSKEWTESEAEKVLAKLDVEGVVEMFREVKGVYNEGGDSNAEAA